MAKPPSRSNSLLAAIEKASTSNPEKPEAITGSEGRPEKATSPAPVEKASLPSEKRAGRAGTRLIAGHFDLAVARQLRLLAAEEDTTIQALLAEALDLLFVKKGRGKIAARTRQE